MRNEKSRGFWCRTVIFILGYDIEQLLDKQKGEIMASISQAVQDIKTAFTAYQGVVATYTQAVMDEMTRVEKELQDLRAPGGGADAQSLEDLATSISNAKDNIVQATQAVTSFELPTAPAETPAAPPAASAPAAPAETEAQPASADPSNQSRQ